MITDKLASYGAAKKEITPGVEHRQHKGLNNYSQRQFRSLRIPARASARSGGPGWAADAGPARRCSLLPGYHPCAPSVASSEAVLTGHHTCNGARALLAQAVEAEVAEFLAWIVFRCY